MMGTKEDPGLTPRLCQELFTRIEANARDEKSQRVSVSYLEIYNERVRDLLKPSSSTSGLRVREHPRLGPYVQGLTHHVVRTLGSLMSYVEEGTKARKTASTQLNPSSSRSHALLTIAVSPEPSTVPHGASSTVSSSARRKSEASPRGGSKLRLVDLAGSENAATCSGVHRLKEGANINKSLVALGNVISALAERGSTGSGPGRRFIPYRDSSLTWLLKDALGGNATTIMLATISPASGSYNETAHTLRFAQRAQSVVNRPVVNEDPVARVIRELRAEVARLKSLLLEKASIETNIEPDKALCFCQKYQCLPTYHPDVLEVSTKESQRLPIEPFEERVLESDVERDQREGRTEEEQFSRSIVPLRRSNSTDSLTLCDAGSSLKRFGSHEFLSKDRFGEHYNRARVTELNDEEDEVSEIHESVFVDIPTLVAVLIKPDDSLQESSTQIEEICSDETAEDGIDVEFIESVNDHAAFEDPEKPESIDHDERSSSVNSCHASGDNEADVYRTTDYTRSGSRLKEKPKFRKQDTVDILSTSIPSNLHTSKRFGSVETIQKKKEPIFSLERSHTNLERRFVAPERAKKLNNIREIDDQKVGTRNLWRGSKEQLQRKSSNDSDKSLKEAGSHIGAKAKSHVRKPSLENLKRKTSKDSSSSSSKDEQIVISSLAREKLLHRKNSLEQESASVRAHTPIQRAKRAEIVAAVTERLYSSKKVPEDASGIRSPPEGTEVRSLARMKLQEISRKMLGKRRRVCVDTQTDCSRTVRMKDTASSTETPEIQDVGVVTDDHEGCEIITTQRTPVIRVKEIATLTDKPKTNIVRCKDVASLATDLDQFEYEIHSPRNDSGILSDDTQNYAESNLSSTEVSDFCQEPDRRTMHAESSTNTLYSSCRSFAVQTPRRNVLNERRIEKSRIAVMDTLDPEKIKSSTKDGEVQTEESRGLYSESVCSNDSCRSTPSQTDSRVFRIENIFQDPNNASKKTDVAADQAEGTRMRNSITFRNSLGTSYVSQAREGEIASPETRRHRGEGFIGDGLITEAFITKKRGHEFGRGPSAIVYGDPWRKWSLGPGPVNTIRSIDYAKGLEPSSWQWRTSEIPVAGLTLSCSNCVLLENGSTFRQMDTDAVNVEPKTSSSTVLETNNSSIEHDHSFSDDSLDYNENNALGQTVLKVDDCELRESLCPPDVVAHTKKDCPKLSSTLETETIESSGDFEESHLEFPKMKPTEGTEVMQIQDYKSLILGSPCYSHEEANEDSDSSCNRVNHDGKKKVSFLNTTECETKIPSAQESSKQGSKTTLKSIIKKRKKRNVSELSSNVQSSNDETDDSQQEEKNNVVPGNHWKEQVQSTSAEETLKKNFDSVDSRMDTKQNNKKVKFLLEDLSENTCSESDSCENAEDEEENAPCGQPTRNILEEYLSEAVTFMKNLNSINEYVNTANMLERYSSPTPQKRVGKQGTRRRSCSSWDRDYLESAGHKVSLKDDTDDEHLKGDDDIVVSTESYDQCLKGIQRLEDCIRRVDIHNEQLREKYGVNFESAGARLSLASPSTDRAPATSDFAIPGKRDTAILRGDVSEDTTHPGFIEYRPRSDSRSIDESVKATNEDDDLEKTIFDQLMNVANSTRCRSYGKFQSRLTKPSDPKPRSPTTYSKLREKYNHGTKEPLYGDFQGCLNLDEVSGNDERQDFTSYEITGNLSVSRSATTAGFNDPESPIEEDFSPSRRFERIERRLQVDIPSSRMYHDDSSNGLFRTVTDSGIGDDDLSGMTGSRTNISQRVSNDDTRERFRESDDYSRRIRDGGSKVCVCSRDQDIEANEIMQFRDKLKYPGSPRARFLELLRERRRIVESSRGTSAS
ncbi:Kinesin-like protein KIF16B [Dufourea novaeangliae]|uniref:Kinesin-like protein KIF16B n=1 Tax=Dufourea novaeangliae TaxID=178035 RepID=A0A154P351_DUFNO|nr:Kinesin-like protein KIF16B [Dufourea novaeangliae]